MAKRVQEVWRTKPTRIIVIVALLLPGIAALTWSSTPPPVACGQCCAEPPDWCCICHDPEGPIPGVCAPYPNTGSFACTGGEPCGGPGCAVE